MPRRHLLALPLLLAGLPSCARQAARAASATTGPALEIGPDGLTQGGLALGQVAPGSRVTLDGKPVRVGPDGRFALGFARDAGPGARLVATAPDGRSETRDLAIATREWDIQRLNGLPPAMVSPNAQQLARIQAERKRIAAARAVDSDLPFFAGPFAWPARARISGVYGSQRILNGEPRAPHLGLDIAAPTGTPVVAMAGGRISLAAPLYFTGNTVILDHGHGIASLYAHLSAIDVAEGEMVRQGQRIGAVGATGRVTGPHLHLGFNWFSTALDPALVLQAT
ncbi:M23 family metallopeptidase [Roseomonas marmotae]|uniref:M23 family metallopeptidase n=1 Tax=Roseomonas marmotae TaxID=2768161 RepID=A0ABS3K7X2_9PROT|nr:M23 family metallopeptidase [Roseomonas marmotae]MBO1073530.1 M23 family metallopeptidase [Roseomonas marmotae]QTI80847.1 M23 family metallopeptidase [Roseomonas marmotae]